MFCGVVMAEPPSLPERRGLRPTEKTAKPLGIFEKRTEPSLLAFGFQLWQPSLAKRSHLASSITAREVSKHALDVPVLAPFVAEPVRLSTGIELETVTEL